MEITVLSPKTKEKLSADAFFANDFFSQKAFVPFDPMSINFLRDLSNKILEIKHITNFPELVALAYWIRKASIQQIINSFQNTIPENELVVPRGIAFHITPSNVDSIFLYSWALSLLVGNLNVIRISSSVSHQVNLLIYIINELMKDECYKEIAIRNFLVSYPHDEQVNLKFSSAVDVRVIWGGDKTINLFRTLPCKPAAKDILFADKFSYTVIKASIYMESNDFKKKELARGFFNDSYWYDQMACASPRIVFFAGKDSECENASKCFWQELELELKARNLDNPMSVAMDKLVYVYDTFSRGKNIHITSGIEVNKPTVIRVNKNSIQNFRDVCGGGFFYECFIENLDELISFVNQKDQTLTYFGFDKNQIKNFAIELSGRGIDRIVCIGQGLSFTETWDGYSLLNELSKRIRIH